MSDNVFAYLDPEPSPGSLAHPEAVWGQAREDYLAGESAGVVCQRYALSRSRFFERAKAEGWRRRDREGDAAREAAEARAAQAAEADAAFVEWALDQPATSAFDLARRAWARAERAILTGRRLEAAAWVRVARDLRRLAMEETGALSWGTAVKRSAPPPPSPAAEPEAVEPAAPCPPEPPPPPEAEPLPAPDAVLASPRKLALWLEQELGPGVRALGLPGFRGEGPDSPDRSGGAPDSPGWAAFREAAPPGAAPPPSAP